ncbi:hypothetical protein MBLNU13_g05840t2 [Cladosporium sp. NU13]
MTGGSPLDAHPLPGTSRFLTTERQLCVPPPYKAQQSPPPYPSDESSTDTAQLSTRSVPFSTGVTFEWNSTKPQSPDDIIIVTVRVNTQNCRESFDDPLPERPQSRGYLRRLASRLIYTRNEWENLRAVRMPRREYLKHHKRDEEGNYAGTEPQQDWDDDMLKSCYGRYQRAPLVPNGLYQNAAMRY